MILSGEQISQLNKKELKVYIYVKNNKEHVLTLKIRELATEIGVSTGTIIRFCHKIGFEGYSEFKINLKMLNFEIKPEYYKLHLENSKEINIDYSNHLLTQVAELINKSKELIFFGSGISGIMAKYGAYHFSNIGKKTYHIDDPWFPLLEIDYSDTLIIAFSISEEPDWFIKYLSHFKQRQAKVVVISNNNINAAAHIANFKLYYEGNQQDSSCAAYITQVPVIHLIESLSKKYSFLSQISQEL